jgi:hypothetical protein
MKEVMLWQESANTWGVILKETDWGLGSLATAVSCPRLPAKLRVQVRQARKFHFPVFTGVKATLKGQGEWDRTHSMGGAARGAWRSFWTWVGCPFLSPSV